MTERRKVQRETLIPTAHVRIGRFGKVSWFPFETLIALLLVITGAFNLIDPVNPNVPQAPLWTIYVTASLYLSAGFFMFVGLAKMLIQLEVAGLILLVCGVTVSTTVLLVHAGPAALRGSLIFMAATWAAIVRIYELMKGRVMIQVEPELER